MALVNIKEMLEKARKEHYAVGAFDASTIEMAMAIVEAAEEEKSPVIVMGLTPDLQQGNEKMLTYWTESLKDLAKKASVPVCLHLDHARDMNFLKRCVDAGFTSVMYDGSALPFEENIKNTRHVVEMAKNYNATVEAELGHVAGKDISGAEDSHSAQLTEPNEVKKFVDETDINALAVSIGTAHGIYVSEPKLNIERLREITAISKVPLVLHGGSGTPENELTAAIHNGITKVNVYSDLRIALGKGMKEAVNSSARVDPLPDKIFAPVKQSISEVVKNRINLFGSAGKASL